MTNINKKYLPANLKKKKKKSWEILLVGLRRANSPEELERVLAKWLTASEMTMLEKRLAIATLSKQGVRHNEIKRILDVSSHTITSIKKGL